jgi:hypothetical protein
MILIKVMFFLLFLALNADAGSISILTYGDCKTSDNTWQPSFLRSLKDRIPDVYWVVDTMGYSGGSVSFIKGKIDGDLSGLTTNYDKIFLNIGVVEISSAYNEETVMPKANDWIANYQYIINALIKKWPNAKIFIAKPWERTKDREAGILASWIDYLMMVNSRILYPGPDESIWIKDDDDGYTMTTDGCHYSLAGNEEMAKKWTDIMSFSTEAVTNVTRHSATLNGTVNPQGAATNYYFEWGPTTAYGNTTSRQSAGSGTGNVAVSADLTGLGPNTAYHYRLVAISNAGTRFGSDMTFTRITTNVDFNDDGKAELFWQNQSTGELYTWFMDGLRAVSMGSPGTVDPSSGWQIKGVADFNGDGKADILWQHQSTGLLYLWLMNGTFFVSGGSPGTVDPSSGWQIKGVADFNGDGKADILWQHQSTGLLYLWLMNGTTFVYGGSPGTVDPSSGWQIKGVADFNGDGKADIFWQHQSTGLLYTWLMNGTTLVSGESPGTANDPNWEIASLADFNGDGKADILWRYKPSGMLYTWFMDGPRVVLQDSAGTVDPSWEIKKIDDFNGDGKNDILWQHNPSGALYIWLMNGTTINSADSLGIVSDSNWTIVNPK